MRGVVGHSGGRGFKVGLFVLVLSSIWLAAEFHSRAPSRLLSDDGASRSRYAEIFDTAVWRIYASTGVNLIPGKSTIWVDGVLAYPKRCELARGNGTLAPSSSHSKDGPSNLRCFEHIMTIPASLRPEGAESWLDGYCSEHAIRRPSICRGRATVSLEDAARQRNVYTNRLKVEQTTASLPHWH